MRIIVTLLFCLFAISAIAQTDGEQTDMEQTNIEQTIPKKTKTEPSGIVKPFQASFVSPLGSNWLDSHLITNMGSFNLLGGHSHGNLYFEYGSLYNINLHLTRGFHMAGIFNYSGNTENATQLAGVSNISMGGNAVCQISAITNIAKESTTQFAGVANITAGPTGTQMSGVFNFAKGAAFQSAPILNVSDGTVGTQLGLLNVAREVNGVQIGLINSSEDMNGVPIGLINIVKNNGKYDFEVGFSESLNTFVSFKFGAQKFYTIFSGAFNYLDDPGIYAAGMGFGTHSDWIAGWGHDVELMSYSIIKEGEWQKDLNMLNQFKIRVSKQFGDYFKVFAGPVFNFTVERYDNPNKPEDTKKTVSPPWSSIWSDEKGKEDANKKTNLNFWIGFEVGVGISM